jgi:uncharacterized small protein (DUF1192 family)
MIEDDRLRDRCGAAARAEIEKRLTDVAIGKRSVDLYQAILQKRPVPVERAATPKSTGGDATAARELADLRQKMALLGADLERTRQDLATAKAARPSWTQALRQVLTGKPSK